MYCTSCLFHHAHWFWSSISSQLEIWNPVARGSCPRQPGLTPDSDRKLCLGQLVPCKLNIQSLLLYQLNHNYCIAHSAHIILERNDHVEFGRCYGTHPLYSVFVHHISHTGANFNTLSRRHLFAKSNMLQMATDTKSLSSASFHQAWPEKHSWSMCNRCNGNLLGILQDLNKKLCSICCQVVPWSNSGPPNGLHINHQISTCFTCWLELHEMFAAEVP